MDEEELRKQQEEQRKQEAGQKAAHVIGKGTSIYLGGQAGGQIYDAASNTKVGKDLENAAGKAIQRNPILNKTSERLNDNGLLDAADKGLDYFGGKVGNQTNSTSSNIESGKNSSSTANTGELGKNSSSTTNTGGLGKNSSSTTNTEKENKSGFASTFGSGSSSNEENNSNDESYISKIFSFILNHKMLFITIGGAFFLLIFIIIIVILLVTSVASSVINFFSGIVDNVIDFFTDDQQTLMDNYYQTLRDVQTEINRKYNICIDVNLITATLTINTSADDFVEEGNESLDPETITNEDGSTTEVSYKKMEKQVRLLANMQIMNQKYSLDKNLKSETGSYCRSETATELVTESNQSAFKRDFFYWMSEGSNIDSSTYELIASHDIDGLEYFTTRSFLTRRENDERNYAYYLYYPPFSSDGTCSDSYAESLLPKDVPAISIGNYATRTETVYYWNLVNSFIPEYYDEYLPDENDPNYRNEVMKIADEIYLFYEDLGPSQTCGTSYTGPSSLCPNGITIDGVGTFDFEEYVAGVVSNEAYTSEGMEALKAQAVAARTYALYYTDYCSKVIPNSTNAQTFTRNINDHARQAVSETTGEILIDQNGKIFSSQYDSFCYDDIDCPDAVRNSDGTYSVTYTKVPNGERHVITLSDSTQYRRILPGQGHAHGMSQLVSYQLAKEGKTYEEILTYFYSDGVTISLVISPTITDDATIIQGPVGDYLTRANSSIETINQYIYSQVKKSGVGTRGGVVSAAVSLVSGFYLETGYKLPYELYPSGKYNGYGIDPIWGTNTGRTDYPLNGLDCSGFISWAIHNGGYAYELKSAQGWGNTGNKRSWSSGTTDSTALPGDLIYNAPQSANGTTGHIKMIVDVTTDGYVVAEASSRNNGVRITTVSFTSTGPYYIVDMSNYYQNATKVTDYPQ